MREFFHRIVVKWRAMRDVTGVGRVYCRLFMRLFNMCDLKTGGLKPQHTAEEFQYYIDGLEFVRIYAEEYLTKYEGA